MRNQFLLTYFYVCECRYNAATLLTVVKTGKNFVNRASPVNQAHLNSPNKCIVTEINFSLEIQILFSRVFIPHLFALLNSLGPDYEFVCTSLRTDNVNCFGVKWA